MKRIGIFLTALLSALLCTLPARAQHPDDLLGTWQSRKEVTRTCFEKNADGAYQARIVWLPEEEYIDGRPPKDVKNPDKALRSRSLIGLVYIKDIRWKGDGWSTSHIYHPRFGLVAKGKITLLEDGTLEVKGTKLGISQTEIYVKVN